MSKESKAYYNMLGTAEQIEYLRVRSISPEPGDYLMTSHYHWKMDSIMLTKFKDIPKSRTSLWQSFNGKCWMIADVFNLICTNYDKPQDIVTWRLREYGDD